MPYPAVEFDALPPAARDLHKENAVLGEIFRATLEASDPIKGVQRAVEILREFFGTASVGAWFVDGDQIQLLGVSIADSVPAEVAASVVNAFERLPLADDLPGTRSMRSRTVLQWEANDPWLDPPTQDALAALGAARLYAFPITLDDAAVGCAVIALPDGRRLEESDQRIVRNVLDRLALLHRMLHPEGRSGQGKGRVAGPEGGARTRPRVLLAESDPITSEVIRHRLEREGFDVLHFDSGDAAAAAFCESEPDLCVVDLKLAGMDGIELLQHIRGTAAGRNVPILVLTALASEKMIARAFSLGADDYVLKPFSLTELTARIRRRLAAGATAPKGV